MAVDDRDRAMAGMLRRSLAGADPPGSCMSADILAAYYERSLDSAETSRCNIHLSQCPRCRQQMAMMARAEVPGRAETHRNWLWDWRLLASAATALLILTLWVVRRSTLAPPVSGTATQPLVAMSKPQEAMTTRPATPPKVSLVAPRGATVESRPRQAPERVSQVPRTSTPEAPHVLEQESSGNSTLSSRNTEDLLKLTPSAKATAGIPPATTQSATAESAASPVPVAPAPLLPPNFPVSAVAGGTAAQAKKAAGAGASKKMQTQSAARASQYGAANQTALVQQAEQRSAATIIATPDPKVLWRIAGGGFVERSEDAGATWQGQLPETNAHLTAGAAPTTKVCWLVGEDGMILLTKDTNHWEKIPPPVPANFVAVAAKNASSATVTTTDGQKFSTSDGGKKWNPAP